MSVEQGRNFIVPRAPLVKNMAMIKSLFTTRKGYCEPILFTDSHEIHHIIIKNHTTFYMYLHAAPCNEYQSMFVCIRLQQ